MATKQPPRRKVTLARELIQRGEVKQPGDEVELRPDQIECLAPEGYFADVPAGKGGAK